MEKALLRSAGHDDLAALVRHEAQIEGFGAGFDIESYIPEGEVKYIEVKTTRGPADTSLFLSANELSFSKAHVDRYYLYRGYNFNPEGQRGSFDVTRGSMEQSFFLTPIDYRATA